jgi:hypothetical protein
VKIYLCGVLTAIALIAFGGCGTEFGHYSRPYIGDEMPHKKTAKHGPGRREMKTITLPGCEAFIDLRNDVKTTDLMWCCWPIIPIPVDLGDEWDYPLGRQDEWCINVQLRPLIDGISVEPCKASLEVGDVHDPIYPNYRCTAMNPEQKAVRLTKDRPAGFMICFNSQRLDPNHDIRLNLNEAIHHPEGIQIPVIRFMKNSYKQDYS